MFIDDASTFDPAALARLRREVGLTRTQLAAAAGREYRSVVYWEQGGKKPAAESLHLVADVLGCEVGALLAGPPPPPDWGGAPPEVTGEFPPVAPA